MAYFTPSSLEELRQKADLVDFLASHIELKKAGAYYKALCPFHDEKSSSFTVRPGDSHYHCFGCGVHGDVIRFAMQHLSLSFQDSVEMLAERYHVHLEYERGENTAGVSDKRLRELNQQAMRLFQFFLLHSEEGRLFCQYLAKRGMDLEFIRRYGVGYAPKESGILAKLLEDKGFSEKEMELSGLFRKGQNGRLRDFFTERITFAIHSHSGAVIGFSARKIREEVFGGKYINTSETPLFKKSKVLFGFHLARRSMAKEQKALICEGQVDVLKLHSAGFKQAVAALGTAFGQEHVRELTRLGVKQATLLFDGDNAGNLAAVKAGNCLMREGIEVRAVSLPQGEDPDSFLSKYGKEAFEERLRQAPSFLEFVYTLKCAEVNVESPAQKASLVQELASMVKGWGDAVLIHESLKRLASLANIPEQMLHKMETTSVIQVKPSLKLPDLDPHRILEEDFIRWLILQGGSDPFFYEVAKENIAPSSIKTAAIQELYEGVLSAFSQKVYDLLSISSRCKREESVDLLETLLQKRIQIKDGRELFVKALEKLLKREWMEEREKLRMEIQNNTKSEEVVLELVQKFDELKRSIPKVFIPEAFCGS